MTLGLALPTPGNAYAIMDPKDRGNLMDLMPYTCVFPEQVPVSGDRVARDGPKRRESRPT